MQTLKSSRNFGAVCNRMTLRAREVTATRALCSSPWKTWGFTTRCTMPRKETARSNGSARSARGSGGTRADGCLSTCRRAI